MIAPVRCLAVIAFAAICLGGDAFAESVSPAADVRAAIEALDGQNPEARTRAVEILGHSTTAAVAALATALADEDQEVRRGAATALGRIGEALSSKGRRRAVG